MLERRAVLECFYGPLWDPRQRTAVIDQAARHSATHYIYGPAGDPRTGGRWREPYVDGARAALEECVARCHALGMAAMWRVSPGAPLDRARSIRIGDPDDLEVLLARISDIAGMGFDGILLAFDDLDPALDPVTANAFGADRHPIAAAQAHLANRVAAHAGELSLDLVFCPTHYWGVTPSRYRARIGELLAAELVLCWTGPQITSHSVSSADATTAAEQYQHRLFLWDNYPVNDWDGSGAFTVGAAPSRLPLAPLRGRDPALHGVLAGYGTNLAVEPRLGSIAASTALDWSLDGPSYDAGESFRRAVREVAGDAADDLLVFADAVGSLPIGGPVGRLAEAAQELLVAPRAAAGARFREVAEQLLHSSGRLHGSCGGELEPWLTAAQEQCSAALAACSVLTGEHGGFADPAGNLRAVADWTRNSIADGLLFPLVQRAIGLSGASEPPWPDVQ